MTTIGIDFGTTNSVIAKWTPSGVDVLDIDSAAGEWDKYGFTKVMPSVFANPNGKILFGWDAKRARSHRHEAVKRLFATQQQLISDDHGEALQVEEVATMLFKQLKHAAEQQGVDATKAVVTVPANSRGVARHRTKICAGLAGIEVLTLLNEPTAAAMAYAARHHGDQQLLVFDWGGGTLDVTILNAVDGVFMEQASKGLPTKGGIDFDSRLAQRIEETLTDTASWDTVEWHEFRLKVELAKVQLSEREAVEMRLPRGQTVRVTRSMFEQAVQRLIEEARRPIEQCLRDIGAGPGAIDALVMVGGTSKVPAVRRFVTELLDMEAVADVDAMTAVGEGAAVAASIVSGELKDNDFFVATEHALGTITHGRHDGKPKFSVLIERNHKLPASTTKPFRPVQEDQDSVLIRVIEGDPSFPVDHPDNVVLAEFDVDVPYAQQNPDQVFDVTYAYDVDGILHVQVHDAATGAPIGGHDIAFGVSEDKRELVKLAGRAQRSMETGTLHRSDAAPSTADAEVATLVQRARVRVIPFVDEEEADQIRVLVDRLQEATPSDVAAAKDALRAALAPYPFLF